MEFQFKNFGNVSTGNIKINDLTVICGPNNTGKTNINHAVYSILSNIENLINEAIDALDIDKFISELDSKEVTRIRITDQIEILSNHFLNMKPIVNSSNSEYFGLPGTSYPKAEVSLKLNDFGLAKRFKTDSVIFRNELIYKLSFEQKDTYITVVTDNPFGKGSKKNEDVLKYFDNDIELARVTIESEIKSTIYLLYVGHMIPELFAVTSERTSISLFNKVFDDENESIITQIFDEEDNVTDSEVNALSSRLALPIQNNIDQVKFYNRVSKIEGFFVEKSKDQQSDWVTYVDHDLHVRQSREVLMMLSDLLDHGSFFGKNDTIMYKPSESSGIKSPIPLYAASSSIKSLFLFDMFIKHVAHRKSMLIIDEPELNLHPTSQIKMAKLVARLVNAGVKVLLTTHSDFFIRELNDLITMNIVPKRKRKRLDKSIQEGDILCKSKVSAYEITPEGKCESLEVNHTGINSKLFEDTIGQATKKSIKVFEAAVLPDEK